MTPITMPQIGQDITTGTVLEWLKEENEPVEKGEVVLVVESEKASFEVEAEEAGVLLKQLVAAGEDGEVLAPVGYLGKPGEAYKEPGRKVKISPVARAKARELGVDRHTIHGTGPGGRIIKQDVLAAAPAAAANAPRIPFTNRRHTIARRLVESKQTKPHFYLRMDVDMEEALSWRGCYNDNNGEHLSVNDLVLYAVADALREWPHMNAYVANDGLDLNESINIGVPTATETGLMVAVVPRANTLTLTELSDATRHAVAAVHDEGARSTEARATFTVSNLGMLGIKDFFPIINPPECAILGVGAAEPQVTVRENMIAIRRILTLSLACDHRAVDGDYAARFLGQIRENLENRFLREEVE